MLQVLPSSLEVVVLFVDIDVVVISVERRELFEANFLLFLFDGLLFGDESDEDDAEVFDDEDELLEDRDTDLEA